MARNLAGRRIDAPVSDAKLFRSRVLHTESAATLCAEKVGARHAVPGLKHTTLAEYTTRERIPNLAPPIQHDFRTIQSVSDQAQDFSVLASVTWHRGSQTNQR
jgi:hypothetical protein